MRSKICFVDTGLDVPVIEIQCNGVTSYAILDTGSECTLFDAAFIKSIKNKGGVRIYTDTEDKEIIMYAMKQSVQPVMADASIILGDGKSSGRPIKCSGLIFNLSGINKHVEKTTGKKIGVIIGSDTLNKYNMKIDFKEKIVSL